MDEQEDISKSKEVKQGSPGAEMFVPDEKTAEPWPGNAASPSNDEPDSKAELSRLR